MSTNDCLVITRISVNMVEIKTVFIIIAFCLIPNLGGFAGSIFTSQNISGWYQKLDLPSWRPPNWLFGPVWTYLYTSMGFAAYLVWRDGKGFTGEAKWPLVLFAVQLILNWMWTPIFFGMQNLKWGFIEITFLTISVWACGFFFGRVNKIAGYLFIPYIMWVTFATCLNFAIWRMNLDWQPHQAEIGNN